MGVTSLPVRILRIGWALRVCGVWLCGSSQVEARLRGLEREALGEGWAEGWWKGLPGCYDNQTGVHVATIMWLWGLVKAWGMEEYARVQYSKLEANRPLWDKGLTKEENWLKARAAGHAHPPM